MFEVLAISDLMQFTFDMRNRFMWYRKCAVLELCLVRGKTMATGHNEKEHCVSQHESGFSTVGFSTSRHVHISLLCA